MEARETTPSGPAHFREQKVNPTFGLALAWSARPLARAAPSASEPNDTVMGIPPSPKRPRDPAQGNMVSQRATPNASLSNQQSLTGP
eukprot:scaffold8634_cov115-Isochrysis_galbana.AAC.15